MIICQEIKCPCLFNNLCYNDPIRYKCTVRSEYKTPQELQKMLRKECYDSDIIGQRCAGCRQSDRCHIENTNAPASKTHWSGSAYIEIEKVGGTDEEALINMQLSIGSTYFEICGINCKITDFER